MTTNDKKITLRNNKVAAVIAVYNDRRAKVKQWAIVSKYAANPDGSLSPLGHDAARCGASCEADALQAAEAFLANPAASGYSWLMPESNTEAAQQHAAELEQAPHPAACICDECLETANSVWELQHPSTGLLREVRQRNGYYDAPKTSRQSHMFAARVDDLPLFSGTAPRGQAQTFDPPAADSHRQAKLF